MRSLRQPAASWIEPLAKPALQECVRGADACARSLPDAQSAWRFLTEESPFLDPRPSGLSICSKPAASTRWLTPRTHTRKLSRGPPHDDCVQAVRGFLRQ